MDDAPMDDGPMDRRRIDWRLPATWAVLFAVSIATRTHVGVSDEARRGHVVTWGRVLVDEITSHLMVMALLFALYWLHRRWPLADRRNLAIHVAAVVPFSLLHTGGMAALRLLWFNAIVGVSYSFPLTLDRLQYEFAKDLVTYLMLTTGVVALNYLLRKTPATVAVPEPAPVATPERFAVRKRGGSEILVEVADIDWIEASGNYAILHVGGDTFEIRSSLSRLESELDPKRFVRVHKSHLVNIARVAEVTPWVSGDWRIRLHDGAEVNLSRRYRQRFEALVTVRS
ncbi:MAG: LytTR family transcriptional regulator [Reyranella sp.]|uniref:LytR/AlgR family response regulator transcription factor n=1 Tax=Reyranella sp. TaxID=1929291 RepID=UPI001ACCE44A|nr:LytTR family DNA-binding domain-containing protein [Reyranella sp.]MBN9086940.1 LytTR family transcriptional regulator [Reyranella sp.]